MRPRHRAVVLPVFAFLALACGKERPHPRSRVPAGPSPDSFDVALATSKGTIVVRAIKSWAPRGVERFYELAGEGFFDENRFFRVLPHFIAQFGASDDLERNKYWEDHPLQDDPQLHKNARGTISFAFLEPNSRTHQLFINLKDNGSLDAQGFVPIGYVVQGMGVADSLYDEYGDYPKYQLIATQGNRYLERMFPKLDYIRTATLIVRKSPSP